MNPWKSVWNATRLEAPHKQGLPRQGPQLKQRPLSQGSAPCRGWSLSTAPGTRPIRLAQTSACKVMREQANVCHLFIKATLSSDVVSDFCFLRFAASRAEDEENLFLASSERKTRLLPGYYWGHLLFPQGLPQVLSWSGVWGRIW